jgi:hypothetical protein
MLPLVLAALLSTAPADALLAMTRALAAAGILPSTAADREAIVRRTLPPSLDRRSEERGEVERWTSRDERCFADFGPAAKITYGCRFASPIEAGAFLRSVVTALAHPIRPPFPLEPSGELHHRAVITADRRLVGVELHMLPEGDEWTAAVVLTPGRRIVARS